MAAPTRSATSAAGTIALILLGGAVATVIGTIMTYFDVYRTVVQGYQHYTVYYALQCAVVGFFTAIGLMLTRPRGPVAPIVAAISGYVALYAGIRAGLLMFMVTHGGIHGDHVIDVLKPSFEVWDLLAPLAAGAIGGLRVLMVASSLTPRRPPGQPFGRPFGQPPGRPFGQPSGQPFGAPGGYGHPTPPIPGQPIPGQPMQGPGSSYQAPPVPGPGQGPAPGGPQGGTPPYGGA
ncbi:PT domain-containing protein [Spirillospora sp. NBC_00431]